MTDPAYSGIKGLLGKDIYIYIIVARNMLLFCVMLLNFKQQCGYFMDWFELGKT